MNRRNFLRVLGAGLPAAVVAEKLGLVERVRSYFFAPKGGWRAENFYFDDRAYFVNAAGIWEARPDLGVIRNISVPVDLTGMRYFDVMPEYIGPYMGISREVPLVKLQELYPDLTLLGNS